MSRTRPTPSDEGLVGLNQAALLAGSADVNVSHRMIDYWVRCDVIAPAHNPSGSGQKRRWTLRQVAIMRALAMLSSLNAERPVLTAVVRSLERNPELWKGSVLVSPDGRVEPYSHHRSDPPGAWWCIPLAECWDYVNRSGNEALTRAL